MDFSNINQNQYSHNAAKHTLAVLFLSELDLDLTDFVTNMKQTLYNDMQFVEQKGTGIS